MTRNHLPMPPVRIVPAPIADECASAEHATQAGHRFRRLLDAQPRRAPAHSTSLAAALTAAFHGHELKTSARTRENIASEPDTSAEHTAQPRVTTVLDDPHPLPQPPIAATREHDDSGPDMNGSSMQDGSAHDRNARTFQPALVSQLERDVVEFCGAADLSLEGAARTVTLTPDPRVLPDTQLTITISPDALSLRFHCESARSRELLCLHGDTLKARLVLRTGRTVDLAVIAG